MSPIPGPEVSREWLAESDSQTTLQTFVHSYITVSYLHLHTPSNSLLLEIFSVNPLHQKQKCPPAKGNQ